MVINQEKTISDILVDKSEVLRYLGHNGQDIDDDLNSQIDQCIEETKENIDIKIPEFSVILKKLKGNSGNINMRYFDEYQ